MKHKHKLRLLSKGRFLTEPLFQCDKCLDVFKTSGSHGLVKVDVE